MLKRSILVGVNQAIVALDIKKFLKKNNFFVSGVVNNGEDLVRHYKAKKPDLIIATFNLRGKISGIDAIKEINQIDSTPIIIISGSIFEDVKEFAKLISPSAVLSKPFKYEELLKLINKYFITN